MVIRPASVFSCISSAAIVFALWTRSVTCQTAESLGCWSGNTPLAMGQLTKVCLFINNAAVSEGKVVASIVTAPETDDYSLIFASGSWNTVSSGNDSLLNTFGNPIAFHLETEGFVSPQKLYRNTNESRTWPIYTAIIAMDKGMVSNVYWDEVCQLCSSDACISNSLNLTNADVGSMYGVPTCSWRDDECTQGETNISDRCQAQMLMDYIFRVTTRGSHFIQVEPLRP